jgi:hypothetical protein
MSTKIYNAYKFNGSYQELTDHIFAFRETWKQYQVDRISEFFKSMTSKGSESPLLIKREDGTYKVSFSKLMDLIEKDSESHEYKIFDVKCEFVIISHNRKLYVILMNIGDNQQKVFLNSRFEDFHYQNQSDPWYAYDPKDDTPKNRRHYKLRKKVWDDVFKDSSSYAEVGSSIEFSGFRLFYSITEAIVNKVGVINIAQKPQQQP